MPVSIEETRDCITLLLFTCPHPCRLRKLLRDFRKLKGHNMPLFGYDNHIDLLKSFDDILVVLDSENERNPEIRLIRREPLLPQRARDIFPGLDDENEIDIDSDPPTNGPRIYNPGLPEVLILQDEAGAFMFAPEPLPHIHAHGHGHGHSHTHAHGHGHIHAHAHGHAHGHGHSHSHIHEAIAPQEDVDPADDGMEPGEEEEEHVNEVWDVERNFSLSFLMRLCMHWMFQGMKMMWNRLIRGF